MTNDIVFDSSALLTYFLDGPGAAGVEEWLQRLSLGSTGTHGWMTTTSLGELYALVMRHKNEHRADRALRAVQSLSITLVAPDEDLCIAAAKLKATHPISHTDALAAALTINQKALLVAADPVFESLHGVPFFTVQYL